jgi:hypothetical protein
MSYQDKDTQNILHWLSPVNFWLKQADVSSQRQPGTGKWLLDHSDFLEWSEGKKETISCVGGRESSYLNIPIPKL